MPPGNSCNYIELNNIGKLAYIIYNVILNIVIISIYIIERYYCNLFNLAEPVKIGNSKLL